MVKNFEKSLEDLGKEHEEEYYQKKSERNLLNRKETEELNTKLARRLFDWKQEASSTMGLYEASISGSKRAANPTVPMILK